MVFQKRCCEFLNDPSRFLLFLFPFIVPAPHWHSSSLISLEITKTFSGNDVLHVVLVMRNGTGLVPLYFEIGMLAIEVNVH